MIILHTLSHNIRNAGSISTSWLLLSTSHFTFDLIEPWRLNIVEDTASSDGILSKCFPAFAKAKFRRVCSDMPATRRGHLSFSSFSPPYPQYCFRKEPVRELRREVISVFVYSHSTSNINILFSSESNLENKNFLPSRDTILRNLNKFE